MKSTSGQGLLKTNQAESDETFELVKVGDGNCALTGLDGAEESVGSISSLHAEHTFIYAAIAPPGSRPSSRPSSRPGLELKPPLNLEKQRCFRMLEPVQVDLCARADKQQPPPGCSALTSEPIVGHHAFLFPSSSSGWSLTAAGGQQVLWKQNAAAAMKMTARLERASQTAAGTGLWAKFCWLIPILKNSEYPLWNPVKEPWRGPPSPTRNSLFRPCVLYREFDFCPNRKQK